MIGNHTKRLPTNIRFRSAFLLVKRGAGSYVDGMYQEGPEEATNQIGNIQIADQDERLNLPEGERLNEAITVYVRSDDKDLIRPGRQGINNSRGDVIRYNNLDYEVYFVDNFSIKFAPGCCVTLPFSQYILMI